MALVPVYKSIHRKHVWNTEYSSLSATSEKKNIIDLENVRRQGGQNGPKDVACLLGEKANACMFILPAIGVSSLLFY